MLKRGANKAWLIGKAQKPVTERFASRGTYLAVAVAAVCGAVLLWRFPALALQYGGGTFVVAYSVALLVIAFPLLVLEVALGQQAQRAAPRAMRRQQIRMEWLGWAGTLVAFVVLCLNVVVAIWALTYGVNAAQAAIQLPEVLPWDADPAAFLTRELFGRELSTGTTWAFPRLTVFLALGALWGVLALLVAGGPRVFGEVLRYLLPLLAVLLLIFVARALLLSTDPQLGGVHGLDWALSVEFARLGSAELWIAAVSHALLACGLCVGVHIALAANLPREVDVANNARVVGLIGATVTLITYLAVASLLGILALHDLRLVSDLPALFTESPADGIGVLLLMIPQALLLTDAGTESLLIRALFSAVFFFAVAGFALAVATVLLHAVSAAIREKWALARWRITAVVAILGGAITTAMLGFVDWSWFNAIDRWVVGTALLLIALLQCITLGWFSGIRRVRRGINRVSEQSVSIGWEICIRLLAPLMLIALLVNSVTRMFGG